MEINKKENILVEYERQVNKKRRILFGGMIILIVISIGAISLGPINLSVVEIFQGIIGSGESTTATVIFNIRLPRIITALVVGASLGLSGVIMQCVLNNPLASASTLGVSQGAAFGAAIGIIIFGGGTFIDASTVAPVEITNPYIVTICAFFFALISTGIIIGISRLRQSIGSAGLILAGVAVSSLFTGGSALIQYFADDSKISTLVFWTFGNLGNASWGEILIMSLILFGVYIFFIINKWNYNTMSGGLDVAQSLGVDTKKTMLLGMFISSLVAAVAVSFVGIISFIGLVAPHITRKIIGDDYRFLIPGTAIVGGLVLLLADTLGRMIISPVVLPVGAITSFLGAPLFIWLLMREGKRL